MVVARPICLGETDEGAELYVSAKERATHMQVMGSIGKGKTTFLERLIRQDIANGHGVCVIDPHGQLYENLVAWCAQFGFENRRKIHLIDPSAPDWRVGFNPLLVHSDDLTEILDRVDIVLDAFSQAWGGEDLDRLPLYQRMCGALLYAIAAKRLTLVEAVQALPASRQSYREYLGSNLPDDVFSGVWEEIMGFSRREVSERFQSAFNRIEQFIKRPFLREMLGQQASIDFQRCMDEGDIVLVNLQPLSRIQGRLLGKLLINSMFTAALRREADRSRPFYLFIDECHRFLGADIEAILIETRKFGLHMTLAHQNLQQLESAGEEIYHAVLTQAQIKVVFGIGYRDAMITADALMADEYDLDEPKKSLAKPFTVGFKRVLHHHRSRTESHGGGDSMVHTELEGETETAGQGESAATATRQLLDDWGGEIETRVTPTTQTAGQTQTSGLAKSTQNATAFGSTSSWSSGTSEGASEALEPIIEWLQTAMYSLEEQRHRKAVTMMRQPVGHAIVKIVDSRTQRVTTYEPRPIPARSERIAAFKERVLARSIYAVPRDLIERELRDRSENLKIRVIEHKTLLPAQVKEIKDDDWG